MDQLCTYAGGALDDAELVARCNMMMAAAGLVAKAQTAEDVLAICSSTSVFVAAFEQLTGKRISGVVRSPKNTADRTDNCRRVVQGIARFFQLDLSHLDPQRIVSGDAPQTASLLELIVAIPKHKLNYADNLFESTQQMKAQESRVPVQRTIRRVKESNGTGDTAQQSQDTLVPTIEESVSAGEGSRDSMSESESSASDTSGESRNRKAAASQARQDSKRNDYDQNTTLRSSIPSAERVKKAKARKHAAARTDGFVGESATRKGRKSGERSEFIHRFLRESATRKGRETETENTSESEPTTREGSESEDDQSLTDEHGNTGRFQFPVAFPPASDPLGDSLPTRTQFRATAGTLRTPGPPRDVSRPDRVTSERRAGYVGDGRSGGGCGDVSPQENDVRLRHSGVSARHSDVSAQEGDVRQREGNVNGRHSNVCAREGHVSTRKGDVSAVLSLVARLGREEDREWERKQAAFAGQLARLSRRAYAPRWPFRPLPDLQNVRRVPRQRPGVRDWVRAEEQRLQKRKKRLVRLRPRGGGRGSGALGLARCRKAYRGFLPASQEPPETEPKLPTTLTDPNRLFSKQTLKQLNDVMLSPVSTLDGPRSKTPNLQTLLQKSPELRQLLVGPRGEIDGQSVQKLFDELPLNPGAKKGLAEKVAGLEAMKMDSGVRVYSEGVQLNPEEDDQEKTWRQVEMWAEGILPKTEPKMRALAQARLRGRLELHQQKRRQIQAERFKEEVVKDQKAAAVKRAEAEERLFKTLLEKAVDLEKEAILAQRKEARERTAAEQRNKQAERDRNEAEIRARCALLKEEILAKRREREDIERAQQQVMRQLAREEKERLEMERAMLLERLVLRST